MSTTIQIKCDTCGATGTIDLDVNISTLNVAGEINVNQPCPVCGGKLCAPGGKYEKGENDILVRVGDYEPNA